MKHYTLQRGFDFARAQAERLKSMRSASLSTLDPSAFDAARRVLADASKVAEPVEAAELFPAEAYTGEDFWRFERSVLFDREWLCVGHVNQAPAPGDHFTITLADEPLVITRDKAGEIHVLSAICQHRGHPLMHGLDATRTASECRNAKLLVCPYHAWSYRLNGALHAAPEMSRTASAATLRRDIRLPRIRHTLFHGLIFINFDPDAPALEPALVKLGAMIENYGVADLVPAAASITPIQSNWKIYQENSLEPYHTDFVHKNSHNPAPANLSKFYDYSPGDGAIVTTTGFADTNELYVADDGPQLPQIAGLTEHEQGRILFVSVLPVLFLVLEPGSVLVTLALPDGPSRMNLHMFLMYPRAATLVPGFAEAVEAQKIALHQIVGEDLVTQEALQRGHGSRFTPKGVFSWLEATIPQMNSWLSERYRAALESASV